MCAFSTDSPLVLTPQWEAYELLDCGARDKLERFGDQVLSRGEPKAWWPKGQPAAWKAALAEVPDGNEKWRIRGPVERIWNLAYGDLIFEARLTDMSKHVGVFPEQEPHWRWLAERLRARRAPKVLNLFGYTGAATLVAAAAGARVTHVDASKPAMAWARHNQSLSGLERSPVRWILDDAFKFVAREVRRANTYEVILLDPPSFGRGPKGEIWKVDQQIGELLGNLRKLLPPSGGIMVLTLYNLEASSLMLKTLLEALLPPGRIAFGELAVAATQSDRLLPLSLFARWEQEEGGLR